MNPTEIFESAMKAIKEGDLVRAEELASQTLPSDARLIRQRAATVSGNGAVSVLQPAAHQPKEAT